GEDAHGCDYFTQVFLSPELCNSTVQGIKFTEMCYSDNPICKVLDPHMIHIGPSAYGENRRSHPLLSL
ncbi:hypothetical protein, partial [Corynebacterium atrinae]